MPAELITKSNKDDLCDPFLNWEGLFVNWKERGNMIELVGREDLNGTPVYNIRMTFKDNDVVNYYIDANKFVVLKMKAKEMIQGQLTDAETIYSDFRDVNGILNPFKTEMIYSGQPGPILIIGNCELNIPVDDSVFKRPVVNSK
jgi:hypothetical protein